MLMRDALYMEKMICLGYLSYRFLFLVTVSFLFFVFLRLSSLLGFAYYTIGLLDVPRNNAGFSTCMKFIYTGKSSILHMYRTVATAVDTPIFSLVSAEATFYQEDERGRNSYYSN